MKAKHFSTKTGRMASFFAQQAGITPGYWRQLLVKDLDVPRDKRRALADAVGTYAKDVAAIAKNLRRDSGE